MEKTTIGIIDDHKIVRQGLKELLEKISNYTITAEFDNGADFLAALPLESPPDLFILDYSMPGMNGIEVLKALEEIEGEYKVLLLTQHFDEQIIDAAYHHGARGFLHKNCTAHDLKFAIDNIVKIGYNNVSEILKRMRNYDESPSKDAKSQILLSDRELEFLKLVCDERELTYDQMADSMGLSVKSIESYRTALFERFGIKSKVGLVLFSFKYQITPPFI
ncbi:DNA-binding NarL/FixJ family response regulator [Flavobacterium gossypii]|uniref:DNA-binding NarL/FixJ family response regulator n=1 Tax=Flavobacterium gossypii TaxID=1646119 RepID=A0ABR6DTL0_9FLAO|nr:MULTISPECIES: response regulator transcription factor [Flavobacterium]MBA9074779.1 DNA-binding NarL/FixJ family response regulator [Flavobacterium gossypii]WDO14351.1 response regulator transcription factor [Flavobacterium sp. WW92]